MNIFQNCPKQVDTKKAEQRLIQLLVAEICFNLDLEVIKQKIENPDIKNSPMCPTSTGLFKTEELFGLVDVRKYKFLDV